MALAGLAPRRVATRPSPPPHRRRSRPAVLGVPRQRLPLATPQAARPGRVRAVGRGDAAQPPPPPHDPRYTPILVHSTPTHGRVAVRPLAPARVPAAAAALAAAFADDADPPDRAWLAGELAREAARYAADAAPWAEGRVDLPVVPWEEEEEDEEGGDKAGGGPATSPPALAIPTAVRPPPAQAGAHRRHPDPDAWRVRVEEAWGRWLWLEAAPGAGAAPAPAAAPCVGAAAVLFHDRAASLAALAALRERHAPLPASAAAAASSQAMDWGLWLRDAPPPAWPPRRAALLWWVGVPPAARRAGIGSALVAAAEAVAAGAGFPRVAVQANRADGAARAGVAALVAALSPPRARPRPAGRALYEAVGYVLPPPPPPAAAAGSVDRSAVLLTKWCGARGGDDDDPWL